MQIDADEFRQVENRSIDSSIDFNERITTAVAAAVKIASVKSRVVRSNIVIARTTTISVCAID